jgi:hypothetical protein
MKYGIKIPFILDHDYMWVTQGDSKFHLKPILFETREEAEEYALHVWGETAIVEVYGETENSD